MRRRLRRWCGLLSNDFGGCERNGCHGVGDSFHRRGLGLGGVVGADAGGLSLGGRSLLAALLLVEVCSLNGFEAGLNIGARLAA